MSGKNYYNKGYFESEIFYFDYKPIANAIIEQYAPESVIEFGCGNGELSKAIAKQGINMIALDGYSKPDFTGFPSITFYKVDLNSPLALKQFLASLHTKFDIAICMEVAEHLQPSVSADLIEVMTSVADTVVFSAAIPEQDGDGHINCRSRLFWHQLFEKQNFFLRDTIRSKIRSNQKVARWYALNTVDYTKNETPTVDDYKRLITNLVDSESESASHFYHYNRKLEYKTHVLGLDMIRKAFNLRNTIKKILGKPVLPQSK